VNKKESGVYNKYYTWVTYLKKKDYF
jgi:hypothetical protein